MQYIEEYPVYDMPEPVMSNFMQMLIIMLLLSSSMMCASAYIYTDCENNLISKVLGGKSIIKWVVSVMCPIIPLFLFVKASSIIMSVPGLEPIAYIVAPIVLMCCMPFALKLSDLITCGTCVERVDLLVWFFLWPFRMPYWFFVNVLENIPGIGKIIKKIRDKIPHPAKIVCKAF